MSDTIVSFFELVADATLFASAFDKAKAKAAEFAAEWQKMGAQVSVSAAQVESATAKVGASGPKLAGGVGAGGLGLIGLQAGVYGLLALGAAAAGVLGITQRLVENYAQFSQQILLNSQAMGMNTADLQTWEKIASVVGIDQQQMVTGFERFAKNLNDGAPALKAAGISLKDLGITTSDTSIAILQLSDYFHTHSDQAQKAAIAMALFGRSGAQLIPILDQGSAAVSKYKDQLQAMGVILSQSQLVAGAQAKAALTEMTTAFEVAKSELVNAALPGFTVFFHTLSVIMQSNASLWVSVGQTIGNVVMFISGLIAGMAGVSIADILAAPADAGNAYVGLGQGAAGAAGGMDAAAQSAAAATAAIDGQIASLREAQRAYDDVAIAEKQALQDQLDKLHDVTDSRRRSGEDIVTYERRLAALKLTDQIKALDTAKANYDRGVSDQIAGLERQKAAVRSAAGTMANDLTAGMNTGMAGLNTSLATGMTKAEQAIIAKGHAIGADIGAIFDPSSKDGAKAAKAAEDLGKILGKALWDGFVSGLMSSPGGFDPVRMGAGAGQQSRQWIINEAWMWITQHHFAGGGITSGPTLAGEAGTEVVLPMNNRSRSLALMEQSGMAALARSAGGAVGGASGALALTINFNGPVADELVASRVIQQLQRELRRRGFQLSGGIG
ncbi:MAG TPA: hypothetical protein VGU71_22565 [Candidatus Dormibacteraeota bacterium]|nr:hypothetical protein [Candidatus Dormibacteraeota bacterium]